MGAVAIVATSAFGRGLDRQGLRHVVNAPEDFDLLDEFLVPVGGLCTITNRNMFPGLWPFISFPR